MPPRDWTHRVEDILESCEKIARYTAGMTEPEFLTNELVTDAVIRNLAIIGEAAAHVPDSVQEKYPEVPWNSMRGMRNILVHEYFGADLKRIWNTVQSDLRPVAQALRVLLDAER